MFKPITTFLILFLIFPNIFCGEDYYKLLGVKRSATKSEIRRAFKKLSLKYHPDKNKDNPEKAKAKFIKIANAYEVLNDDKLRKIYDEQGEEGVKQHQQGGGQHGGNFQDIFNFFFRGANMNFQNQEGPEKNFFENTDVLTLKMENISKLLSRRKIWFVYFFKSKDEGFENMNNKIKEISSQCYGIFNFGAVNCKDDEEICEEYSVYSTPKIVYFPESANEVEEEYKGNIDFQSIFKYGAN
jgi:DnaJ-class molecular chaperone